MNTMQKRLLIIYLPLTFIILILDHIYPNIKMILRIKYIIMVTLFLSSIIAKKKFHEQKIMALSLFFLVIGDFFLVFYYTLDLKMDLSPIGALSFLCAYICLIIAYHKNFKIDIKEIFAGIFISIILIYIFFSLSPYVHGFIFVGSLIFSLVLSFMTWTGICTLFRNYFTRKISKLIATSSILMFICDIGVAFSRFYPIYSKPFIPWLQNIIWITYIPGWTLLAVIIADDTLKLI